MYFNRKGLIAITFILTLLTITMDLQISSAITVRVKDIAYVEGVRENQLYGYGLVVGLLGTGDSQQVVDFTTRILANVYEKLGVIIPNRQQDFISRNIALVMITADIPAFVKPGTRLDVLVSTVGDAKSLKGGVLLQTALQGADGEVYAVAQGPVSIGSAESLGGQAQQAVKNHPTVGTIPNGAIIEQEIPFDLFHGKYINLVLKDPDFTTSTRLVRAINNRFEGIATPISPALVRLEPTPDRLGPENIIQFISDLEEIPVSPDSVAKVIINERTGTIVVGKEVRISTVAIAHGNLTITIMETPEASQPSPFGAGATEVLPRTDIQIDETRAQLRVIPESATVSDVARALNILGVTPRDLISIFQAIKKSGSLHAELILM